MTWASVVAAIATVTSLLIAALAVTALRVDSLRRRKNILITITILAALTVALYWTAAPIIHSGGTAVRLRPSLPAHIGLWLFKIVAILSATA